MEWTSFIIYVILIGFMFKIVPVEIVKQLFGFSLVAGLLVAIVLLYIMKDVFGFWDFIEVDIFNIGEIPVFLSASWMPVVIIFVYWLRELDSYISIILINIIFPLGATFLHYIFLLTGQLRYTNWNLFYTFLISLFIHVVISLYFYLSDNLIINNRV